MGPGKREVLEANLFQLLNGLRRANAPPTAGRPERAQKSNVTSSATAVLPGFQIGAVDLLGVHLGGIVGH
eukprot:611047-Pyramimonas_sp.AAC.1